MATRNGQSLTTSAPEQRPAYAAIVRLRHRRREIGQVTASSGIRSGLPILSSTVELGVIHMQCALAQRKIKRNLVSVVHKRNGPTNRRFWDTVHSNGTV